MLSNYCFLFLLLLPISRALCPVEALNEKNRHHTSISSSDKAMTEEERIHYSPFLDEAHHHFDTTTTAMVILNSPIRKPPSPLFEKLWSQSSFHICADGGANRLYRATMDNESETYKPDLITGDLDSLKPKTREYYESMQVRIVKQYDQDFNDLDKSIRSIPETYRTCFVYGAFGGRFDQEMASVQALFNYLDTLSQIWLFSDENAAILLKPGEHSIFCPNFGDDIPERVIGEGPTCGLIPIGHPCEKVTTTGLKWNLDANPLEFGGLVSTSNRLMASKITVKCSHPLLFTVEVDAGIDTDDQW